MNSPRFTLNQEQAQKILKVLGYSLASVVIATIPSLLNTVTVQPEYVALYGLAISLINTIIVAAKKFIADEKGELI